MDQEFWKQHANDVTWFSDGTINAAYNAIDRHLTDGKADKVALIYEAEDGTVTKYTFSDIAKKSNKIANLLKENVVNKGDRAFLFLPRIP